jgi:hypothetical protein
MITKKFSLVEEVYSVPFYLKTMCFFPFMASHLNNIFSFIAIASSLLIIANSVNDSLLGTCLLSFSLS